MTARYVAAQRPSTRHAPDRDHNDENVADWIIRNNRPTKGGLTFDQWLARRRTPATAGAKKKTASAVTLTVQSLTEE